MPPSRFDLKLEYFGLFSFALLALPQVADFLSTAFAHPLCAHPPLFRLPRQPAAGKCEHQVKAAAIAIHIEHLARRIQVFA